MKTKPILKTSLIIIFLGIIILVSGCGKTNQETEISPEEKEFNDSGRAKAILDEKDLLPHYVNDLQGKWIQDPLYKMNFIVCKANGAIDWFNGVRLGKNVGK